MINYAFWDNDYNDVILQKEVQHTKEEIQEMALEFFNNYEKYRVDDDFNYCENFIHYLVIHKGFTFPKIEDDNIYDIDILKGLAKQEEDIETASEVYIEYPEVDTTDISNTFMNCSLITSLPKVDNDDDNEYYIYLLNRISKGVDR